MIHIVYTISYSIFHILHIQWMLFFVNMIWNIWYVTYESYDMIYSEFVHTLTIGVHIAHRTFGFETRTRWKIPIHDCLMIPEIYFLTIFGFSIPLKLLGNYNSIGNTVLLIMRTNVTKLCEHKKITKHKCVFLERN